MNMFGWGIEGQIPSDGVSLPLRARAMVIEDPQSQRRIAFVVCDLGMISESIRRAVVDVVCTEERGLEPHDVTITATHTHSGPSGFSTYLFYALSGPGVSREVHDGIAKGISSAIDEALAALQPARAWVHAGWIPASEPVAFNRSIDAYNQNTDVSPVARDRAEEAVERTMTVLRVDAIDGPPLGLVSWFPVHGTSVHSDQRAIHGDNKGHAARDAEAWAKGEGYGSFVALFAQESAGDVSPNYRPCPRRKLLVGRYDDDDESARFNGDIQSRHARALWARSRRDGEELSGGVDAALRHRDFFSCEGEDRAADRGACTALPRLGLGFSFGTLEGPGPLRPARGIAAIVGTIRGRLLRTAGATSWQALHGNKLPLWDLGSGPGLGNKVFGVLPARPGLLELVAPGPGAYYRRALHYPFARSTSWVPRYLPFQILRIGSLVIGTLPQEATTNAGRRIRRALAEVWGKGTRVVVSPYSNAYCGYLTTPEEYDVQAYEGAATLFGRGSLAAVKSELLAISRSMIAGTARASLGRAPRAIPFEDCLPR